MGFSGYFKSLIDVNRYFRFLVNICRYFKSLIYVVGYLILIKFSGIIRSVESSEFLKYKVDINRNLRLMDLSKFLKFQFGVKVVSYRAFLLTTGGSK